MLTWLGALSSVLSLSFDRRPHFEKPQIERSFVDTVSIPVEHGSDIWHPYPIPRPPQPAFYAETLHALCDLSEIMYDFALYNFDDDIQVGCPEDIHQRVSTYKRLLAVERNMPPTLKSDVVQPPHITSLQLVSLHLALRPRTLDTFEPTSDEVRWLG